MTPVDPTGPVTLINGFTVPVGRDEAFLALWTETSTQFRAQPGFVSLRLHRAVSPEAPHRYVNVARWTSHAAFKVAHAQPSIRQLLTQPAWREFPSSPALYEEIVAKDA